MKVRNLVGASIERVGFAGRYHSYYRRYRHASNVLPALRQEVFKLLSKILLSSRRAIACASCRKLVSVSGQHRLLHALGVGLLPLSLLLVSLVVFDSHDAHWLGIAMPVVAVVFGVALEAWLYYRLVPLAARAD